MATVVAHAGATTKYAITSIVPWPKDATSFALGISEDGVGYGYESQSSSIVATIYRRGKAEYLPRVNSWATEELVFGRTASGLILGRSEHTLPGMWPDRIESWILNEKTGVIQRTPATLTKINSSGKAVGEYNGQPVTWQNGVLEVLPFNGFDAAIALGISDDGDVVGWAGYNQRKSMLWRNGQASRLTPFEGGGFVQGITAGGLIYGDFLENPLTIRGDEVRRYRKTYPGDIRQFHVSDTGLIVADANFQGRPWVWTDPDVPETDLNYFRTDGLPVWMHYVSGMNSQGQIIGKTLDGRLFIATPVPEPATLAALAIGLFAIVRRRKTS